VPITSPNVPRETGVPAMVTAGWPNWRVVPATTTSLVSRDMNNSCLPMVMDCMACVVGKAMVEVPTISPLVPREIGVPDIVTTAAFGANVVPAITMLPFARAVTAWPAAVMRVPGAGVGTGIIDVPITKPSVPKEIGVPDMDIAGALGVKVVPAIAMPFERTVAG